ncbi:hypothetical protein E2C01_029276 [Portunus trituberculatus]|uniref:Uncharacterized protein n=1 Tax=Portunus trituberculatus TaxID=210409 RepID=A0A5B7ERT1_PORTR|nr:hypothetical protein [Portunus trituberculatus]
MITETASFFLLSDYLPSCSIPLLFLLTTYPLSLLIGPYSLLHHSKLSNTKLLIDHNSICWDDVLAGDTNTRSLPCLIRHHHLSFIIPFTSCQQDLMCSTEVWVTT